MRALFLAVCLLVPAPLWAQVDCANAVAQMEMTYCAEQDWKAADADLNAAYGAARDMMRGIDADLPVSERGAEQNLKEAQRAWITFRDKACAAEGYTMHSGSAEPMVVYGCMANLTAERARGLWSLTGGE